ncbi:MAG: RidA family protein [Bacteroidota bacterium]
MKKIINSDKAPAPLGPYSQAVKAGNMLFVSGQIAINQESGAMVLDNIEEETAQVMKNLDHVLKEAELGFQDVVKCSIFISDMSNFTAINAIYGEFFPDYPPARETVEVSGLPKGVNVEISCIAVFS